MAAAAPPCRLYLTLPARPPAAFDTMLTKTLAESEPACVLLSDDAGLAEPRLDTRLREITAARDIALLVENDAERAERIGADGVHLPPDAALFRQARERLGQRAIIGVGCIESRHDAMVMAELGADYVAFGAPPGIDGAALDRQAELIAWWSEIFVVPCVAWDVATPEAAARLAGLGADFVALPASVWQSEDPVERIARIGAALPLGRSAA